MNHADDLANTLQSEHRLDEAAQIQRETLEIRRKLLGPDNPDTLFNMNNLASVLADQGRFYETEALYQEALRGERRVLGENHPEVAYVFFNLATVEARRGRREQALNYLRDAVQHGYDDPDVLNLRRNTEAISRCSGIAKAFRRSTATKRERQKSPLISRRFVSTSPLCLPLV